RCFELMSRYAKPPLTAGDLARATGLTTGAVTGILDRLEKAGLVERFRDPSDRRKVFVRPLPEALRRVGRHYEGLAAASMKLASSFSTAQLQVIHDYLERILQILRNQTTKFT
ncbi:MAG: MarR family transcriptional regulator, partial [Candidatus Acidiferrum sp.]